jgi:hypothetical protein
MLNFIVPAFNAIGAPRMSSVYQEPGLNGMPIQAMTLRPSKWRHA